MSQSRGDSSEKGKMVEKRRWTDAEGKGEEVLKLKAKRRDDRRVDVEKHQDAWRENSC